jgi:hypothetical protein
VIPCRASPADLGDPVTRSRRAAAAAWALVAGVALAVASTPASAQAPSTTSAPPSSSSAPPSSSPPPAAPAASRVTAILLDGKDLRQSTLLGPSGQVYEPTAAPSAAAAPASPRWVRRAAGGVSSSVAAAFRLDGQLFVAGSQTPLFRQRAGQWQIVQLGQRGKVVLGTGPFFTLSVGRQIFFSKEGRFLRLATAPGPVVALWAASETAVLVATDQGVSRRRGNAFVPVGGKLPGVLGFTGAAPHALTADLAVDCSLGRKTAARVRLPGQAVRAVRSDASPAALVRTPAGALVLARDLTSASSAVIELPASAASAGSSPPPPLAAVDAAGRALIVLPEGVRVYDGAAWHPTALADELPPPRNGPSPARSR